MVGSENERTKKNKKIYHETSFRRVFQMWGPKQEKVLLALKHVYYSKGKPFLILSDSLSSLQSILNLKYDHPVLVQILELYTEMTRERREIVFI